MIDFGAATIGGGEFTPNRAVKILNLSSGIKFNFQDRLYQKKIKHKKILGCHV